MDLSHKHKLRYPYTNIKTEGRILEVAPVPHRVKIPLLSTKGKVGTPLIQKGHKVLEGDRIGQFNNFFFHASISGTVTAVENEEIRVSTTDVLMVPIISIEFSGKIVNWHKNRYDYLNRSAEELKQQIIKLGVEHMNPTSLLTIEDILNFTDNAHLVVSALEVAPMVSFGEELLLQDPEAIHTALSIVEYIIQPEKTTMIVGKPLKNHYFHPQKEVIYMDFSYPNGYEARIFEYLTHEEMTKENLYKRKTVFIDIQTLYHIYNAIILQKPFIEHLVTIDGKVSKNPAHYFVRVGMSIKELIEDTGVYDWPKKILSGNIFNSDLIYDINKYLSPSSYSLLLLDEEANQYGKFEDCIQCNLCHTSCPTGLYPYEIAQFATSKEEFNKCISCGICSYSCPASIPLGYFLELKREEL